MPNHVTNFLTIRAEGELLEKIKSEICSGKGDDFTPLDFNKILPRPEDLNITSGSSTDNGLAILAYKELGDSRKLTEMLSWHWPKSEGITDVDSLVENMLEKGRADMDSARQALNNIINYGHADWYSWSIDKWGTKWNAYSTEDNGDEIVFQTAWSCPDGVLIALSQQYPDVEFKVRYADEDFGANVGEFTLLNGVETWSNIPDDGSNEALHLAMDILNDEWRVNDCLSDIEEDTPPSDWSGYEKIMCEFAYSLSMIDSSYPECVLGHLEKKAIARENYELAALIKEARKEKEEE